MKYFIFSTSSIYVTGYNRHNVFEWNINAYIICNSALKIFISLYIVVVYSIWFVPLDITVTHSIFCSFIYHCYASRPPICEICAFVYVKPAPAIIYSSHLKGVHEEVC